MDLGLGHRSRARPAAQRAGWSRTRPNWRGGVASSVRSERKRHARVSRAADVWRRDGGFAAAASSSMSTIGATRLAPGACAGDAAIATQFGSARESLGLGRCLSRSRRRGRARRATVASVAARPCLVARHPRSPAVDARARLSWARSPARCPRTAATSPPRAIPVVARASPRAVPLPARHHGRGVG